MTVKLTSNTNYVALPRDQMIEQLEISLAVIQKQAEFLTLITPLAIEALDTAIEATDFAEVAIPEELADALAIVGTRKIVVRSTVSEPDAVVEDDSSKPTD